MLPARPLSLTCSRCDDRDRSAPSPGVRRLTEALHSASCGVDVMASVVIIAAGLVVGLLVAGAVLPARRERTLVD